MIVLFPLAGLCNRMRVIDSAVSLSRKINKPLKIIWLKDEGLNCSFRDLFMSDHGLNIIEESIPLKYQNPTKRNLFLPRVYQRLNVDKVFRPNDIEQLFKENFDFEQISGLNQVFIYSYEAIYNHKKKYDYFKPIDKLQEVIIRESKNFDDLTIGVHIRRTDNKMSIDNSPLELFIEAMKIELAKEKKTKFFLATDCLQTKAQLIKIFGEHIITRSAEVKRNSTNGIQSALIDLFLLSRTNKIFGSFWSSFSETAADLSGIEVIYLTKDFFRKSKTK